MNFMFSLTHIKICLKIYMVTKYYRDKRMIYFNFYKAKILAYVIINKKEIKEYKGNSNMAYVRRVCSMLYSSKL